eukprot:scaffold354_cov215-Alexandrium_tamarense.AAC.9
MVHCGRIAVVLEVQCLRQASAWLWFSDFIPMLVRLPCRPIVPPFHIRLEQRVLPRRLHEPYTRLKTRLEIVCIQRRSGVAMRKNRVTSHQYSRDGLVEKKVD